MRTIKMRAHLNADALFATIRKDFGTVSDRRAANASIPLVDALMSGFAMFSLKDPSLLAFDERRLERPESLHGVFGVGVIPSDTQMRTILDEVVPTLIRQPFRSVFHQLQRGKVLPKLSRSRFERVNLSVLPDLPRADLFFTCQWIKSGMSCGFNRNKLKSCCF